MWCQVGGGGQAGEARVHDVWRGQEVISCVGGGAQEVQVRWPEGFSSSFLSSSILESEYVSGVGESQL